MESFAYGMRKPTVWYVLPAALCVLIVGTLAFLLFHAKIDKATSLNDSTACLHDADCRSRLEAAVNSIYSEIGYDNASVR